MQLTEAEIANLIGSWVGVTLQYPMDEPPDPEEWPIATIFNMDKAAHAIAEAEAEKMREALVHEMAAINRHMEVTPKDSKWFMWNHGYRDCLDALLHEIPIGDLLDLQKEE